MEDVSVSASRKGLGSRLRSLLVRRPGGGGPVEGALEISALLRLDRVLEDLEGLPGVARSVLFPRPLEDGRLLVGRDDALSHLKEAVERSTTVP